MRRIPQHHSRYSPRKGHERHPDENLFDTRCKTLQNFNHASNPPRHYQVEADKLVCSLVNNGIIAPVGGTTAWTAPAFLVPKNKQLDQTAKNNLRLVTDLSQLNCYIIRPVHPFPSANTILSNIPNSTKYFASLDAVSGYHQVPLDEQSSYLTTFLLPCGRFRYLRTPMGLCSSSNEWCRRSDATIDNIRGNHKLVDDYLITGDSILEITNRIREVLQNCRRHNLTISKRKFVIGKKIKFAGFHLSKDGIEPDNAKTDAISKFPTPKDVNGVRSFLCLTNQLAHFIPNLAAISDPIRQLLKKNTALVWMNEHDDPSPRSKKHSPPIYRYSISTQTNQPI